MTKHAFLAAGVAATAQLASIIGIARAQPAPKPAATASAEPLHLPDITTTPPTRSWPRSLSLAHLLSIGRSKPEAAKPTAPALVITKSKAAKSSPSKAVSHPPSYADMRAGDSLEARARRRERQRCEAIVLSPLAARNPTLAWALAFQTRAPRVEALALLAQQAEAVPAFDWSAARAARNPRIGPGGGAPSVASMSAGIVTRDWDQAFAKATSGAQRPR